MVNEFSDINFLEKKSYGNSLRISWCWTLTHVCWQCCNAACSRSKTGLSSKQMHMIFLFILHPAQENFVKESEPPVSHWSEMQALQCLTMKIAVWYNRDKQHIWRHFVWWGFNDYGKYWDASICQSWWIGMENHLILYVKSFWNYLERNFVLHVSFKWMIFFSCMLNISLSGTWTVWTNSWFCSWYCWTGWLVNTLNFYNLEW